MKATDLNQAFCYVEDAYLMEVDAPEKENLAMKNKKRTRYIFFAAALICLLSITAYAVELLNIHSYQSGSSKIYQQYSEIDQALAQVGLQAEIPEGFSNGFRFQRAKVQEVDAMDEAEQLVLTLKELQVFYTNTQGQTLVLVTQANLEGLPKDDRAPTAVETVGDVELSYYRDYYRFVPEDYQLTEVDEEWANQPGHYISYGSDQVHEQISSFLSWRSNDVSYAIMDWNAFEPEVLFAMAEEMME